MAKDIEDRAGAVKSRLWEQSGGDLNKLPPLFVDADMLRSKHAYRMECRRNMSYVLATSDGSDMQRLVSRLFSFSECRLSENAELHPDICEGGGMIEIPLYGSLHEPYSLKYDYVKMGAAALGLKMCDMSSYQEAAFDIAELQQLFNPIFGAKTPEAKQAAIDAMWAERDRAEHAEDGPKLAKVEEGFRTFQQGLEAERATAAEKPER